METENNLLEEFSEKTYVYASAGQRFLNFVIDLIAIYMLMAILGVLMGIITALTGNVNGFGGGGLTQLIFLFLYFSVFFLYYTLLEGTKGKSLGKLITKTRVLSIEGERITYGKAFVRTLIRFLPFEFISGFSGTTMWHDQWTYTMLIKDN